MFGACPRAALGRHPRGLPRPGPHNIRAGGPAAVNSVAAAGSALERRIRGWPGRTNSCPKTANGPSTIACPHQCVAGPLRAESGGSSCSGAQAPRTRPQHPPSWSISPAPNPQPTGVHRVPRRCLTCPATPALIRFRHNVAYADGREARPRLVWCDHPCRRRPPRSLPCPPPHLLGGRVERVVQNRGVPRNTHPVPPHSRWRASPNPPPARRSTPDACGQLRVEHAHRATTNGSNLASSTTRSNQQQLGCPTLSARPAVATYIVACRVRRRLVPMAKLDSVVHDSDHVEHNND